MPTPTIHWAVDASGDWATTADWRPHRLPNSTDDVAIDTADVHVVTHSVGTSTVHSLTVGNDIFVVSGGSLTVNSTSSFDILLSVSGGTMRFGGAATAALLSQSGGTVSGAGTLTVTGQTTFASALAQIGTGRTVLAGDSKINDSGEVDLDGGRTLENQGVFAVTRSARIVLGKNLSGGSGGNATLKNDAAGTIDMQGDNNQIESIVGGVTRFINAGTLKKTGGGRTIVGVNTRDTGSIEAVSGTLEFFLGITGDGSLAVDTGATLSLDSPVAATLDMTFNGGTLSLRDPASFAATIHAFSSGDTIDLLSRTATKATLGAGDTLVIKNGTATIATLQLAGNHTGDTFNVASDGHGGTNITVTSGPAHAARFTAAMAGIGGAGQGSVFVSGEAPHARPPMLTAPRMAMA
ncbi:MAG: hypothetical protein H0X27_04050 [Caulobacteraceae bacterium]|nr:hypothetical protein [Caulobacteraceae bacterium]